MNFLQSKIKISLTNSDISDQEVGLISDILKESGFKHPDIPKELIERVYGDIFCTVYTVPNIELDYRILIRVSLNKEMFNFEERLRKALSAEDCLRIVPAIVGMGQFSGLFYCVQLSPLNSFLLSSANSETIRKISKVFADFLYFFHSNSILSESLVGPVDGYNDLFGIGSLLVEIPKGMKLDFSRKFPKINLQDIERFAGEACRYFSENVLDRSKVNNTLCFSLLRKRDVLIGPNCEIQALNCFYPIRGDAIVDVVGLVDLLDLDTVEFFKRYSEISGLDYNSIDFLHRFSWILDLYNSLVDELLSEMFGEAAHFSSSMENSTKYSNYHGKLLNDKYLKDFVPMLDSFFVDKFTN